MTIARHLLINPETTRYYHCINRCVRRAFLCGEDALTGQSFEHRRQWIEDLMFTLAEGFCLDIVAYAIMSNHYHIILRIDSETAQALTPDEVIKMRCKLYSIPSQYDSFPDNTKLQLISKWREQLTSISHFMAYLNQHIARLANQEDKCKGRFWQGRFKSQALLDDTALLTCMAYIELNPVRAGMAKTPEQSQFTSIKRRLTQTHHGLYPLQNEHPESDIQVNFAQYLELIDYSARIIRSDKTGYTPNYVPDILNRLNMKPDKWQAKVSHKPKWFYKASGSLEKLKEYCQAVKLNWVWKENETQ